MKILVNAEPRDIRATNLADALPELGFDSPAIATALNGDFIPRAERAATALGEGDRLEVLAPMQGG
ncbi:sulfur carrier protein ThiS [Actibacterium ureilyticum]|uniref:sulfur carrier protein ThiS n=1 Tax=Actibacterium ureilyticum TaxID=1590614 RepID=UPI000BAAB873|nr:sulfur carrier protein ThiS [Actibacterium ureilyticum]